VLGSAVARAQEQVVNGGFETTDINGVAVPWIYSGQGVGLTTSPVHLGLMAMEFSKANETDTLTQTGFNAPWGHEFLVTFWLYNDQGIPGGVKSFKATFDGNTYDLGTGPTPGQWTQYWFNVNGSGDGNASLEFEGQYDFGAFVLDDVSVYKTGNIIPEPALIQLPVLLGLAGLGYWRRRRSA